MDFETYLGSLLGEKEASSLMDAIRRGDTIIISGDQQTGRTTLCRALKERGCNAVEDFQVHNVTLNRILDSMTPNFIKTITF